MVNLLFAPDNDILTKKGIVKTLYDPACGTGGMLTVAEQTLQQLAEAIMGLSDERFGELNVSHLRLKRSE
jgi:type I restriction-modification system DNA methylase subunit